MCLSLISLKQYIIKLLLDSVFVISGISKTIYYNFLIISSLISLKQYIIKLLLDSVFVISGISKTIYYNFLICDWCINCKVVIGLLVYM